MATELDSIVEAFEQARAEGRAIGLRQFLPPADSDSYRDVALELMRVDLEYSWQTDSPKRLDDYLAEHGDVLNDRAALASLAFEEFRLRRAAGRPARREEYARRYGLDTSHWPDEEMAAPAAKFPRIGDLLLGFHLVRELGRGAFGRVYLAEQADLAHRRVAVKVTTEFTAEPERLAQLQHANIVPVYSLHRHEGLQVLCMPYCGDRTLAHWLRDLRQVSDAPGRSSAHETADARLDETNSFHDATSPRSPDVVAPSPADPAVASGVGRVEESLRIMLGVASGLAHAHRRGIVHRDLKPANVLLGDDGVPRLLDFNLATATCGSNQRADGVGGTLPYMSPEQLLSLESGAPVDAASDVFACGVLLVETLTGRRPFPEINGQGRALWRGLRAQRLHGFDNSAKLARIASVDVASIARKCLAPEKADRYPSAAELEEDLRRHLEHLPLRHAPNRSLAERTRKWARRHPRLGSAAGVATVAAVLLLCAISLLVAQKRRAAQLDASNTRQAFVQALPEIRAALTTRDLEPGLVELALDNANRALAPYINESSGNWQESDRIRLLNEADRLDLVQDINSTLQAVEEAIDRLPAAERGAARVAHQHLMESSVAPSEDSRHAMDELAKLRELTVRRLLAFEYPEAAAAAQRWVELSPRDFEAQFQLGNALAGCGRWDEAEQSISICMALSPRSLLAAYERGVRRLEVEKWTGAREDFSRVLKLRPGFAPALVNRAIARERLGDTNGAIDDLSVAIETQKAPTRAYFMRGRLYARLGQRDKAQADHERGLALVPNDTQSWIARGMAQLPHNPEKALEDFQRALRLNPREPNALRNSATVLSSRLNRPEDAIAELSKLLAFRPADARALAGRAVLYARQGRAQEALADIQRLAATNTTAVHHYQTACVYALLANTQSGRRAEALRMLAVSCQQDAQLAELAPRDPDFAALHDDPEFRRIVAAAQELRKAGQNEAPGQP